MRVRISAKEERELTILKQMFDGFSNLLEHLLGTSIADPADFLSLALQRPAPGSAQIVVPRLADGRLYILEHSPALAPPWRAIDAFTAGPADAGQSHAFPIATSAPSGFFRVHLWVLLGVQTLAALALFAARPRSGAASPPPAASPAARAGRPPRPRRRRPCRAPSPGRRARCPVQQPAGGSIPGAAPCRRAS